MNSESLCAPGDQPEKEREKEREREREREREDMGTRALMEQRCFNQHGVGIYTVVIHSKDKDSNSRLIKHRRSIL